MCKTEKDVLGIIHKVETNGTTTVFDQIVYGDVNSIIIEQRYLDMRLTRLFLFAGSKDFHNECIEEEKKLIMKQLAVMKDYNDILLKRIELLTEFK